MNYQEAKQIVELCDKAGIKLEVNSNMRYAPFTGSAYGSVELPAPGLEILNYDLYLRLGNLRHNLSRNFNLKSDVMCYFC